MNKLLDITAWLVFFTSAVYGHIGLKLGVDKLEGSLGTWRGWWELGLNPWAWSGITSWVISSVVWIVLLSKQDLFAAHSISALRYVLVALGAAFILRETTTPQQWLGATLIAAGVFLVARHA